MVSRSPALAVTLNSNACPGQMSPGLLAPTGVSMELTWTMPGWPFRDFASGAVGPSSASASSPMPRSGSPDVNSGARLVWTTERTGATPTGSVFPLESLRAWAGDTFSMRTVNVSSGAWAEMPPANSSSVASTESLRVVCDMVDLLHSQSIALDVRTTQNDRDTSASSPPRKSYIQPLH